MPNFEENIVINWQTAQAEEQARRLDQVLQTLNVSLGQIRESAQGAFSTIAGSLSGISSSVAALNAQLSETARLMEDIRSIPPGAQVIPSGATPLNVARDPRTGRFTSMEGRGGGGGYTLGDIPVSHQYMGRYDQGELASRRFEGPEGLLGPVGMPSEAAALRSQTYNRVVENLGDFDRQVSETSLAFNNMGELSERVTRRWFERLNVDQETGAAQWARQGDIVTARERIPTGLPGPADLSAAPIFNNINRELTEQAKAYNLGSQLDEGFAYVNKVEEEQRMQARMARYRQAQATLAEPDIGAAARAERERAMQAAYEVPDPGGRFPLARQAYLQQQVQMAQATYAQAVSGFQRGVTSAAEVEKAGQAYGALNKELTTAQNGVNLLSNMWVRHLFWIGQTIIILEGLRLIGGFISELATDVGALADASARLGVLQPGIDSRAMLGGALTREGAYGVSPANVVGGQVMAAQFRAPPGVTETAGQLALAFDAAGQYDEILNEVIQTSIRGNGVMADQARILDLVAALYKTAPGSLSEYMDAIQNAIPLSEQLGLSIETTAMILERVSSVLETTPSVTAGLLGKVVLRTAQPEVQREMQERFGIQPGAPAEMFQQIGQAIQQFDTQGNTAALNDLFVLISGGGGAQARQDIVRMGDAFREITPILESNVQTTGQWAAFFAATTGTITTDIREMTSAAQAFIAVWANSGPVQNFFGWLGDQIDKTTAGLQAGAEQETGRQILSGMSPNEKRQALEDFIRMTGGGTLGFMAGNEAQQNTLLSLVNAPAYAASRVAGMRQAGGLAPIGQANIRDDIEIFLQSIAQRPTGRPGIPDEPVYPRGTARGGLDLLNQQPQFFYQPGAMERPGFGGLRELGDMGIDDLRSATQYYEHIIRNQAQAAGVDYEAKKQTFLIWDEAANRFQAVTTTSDALAMAFKRLEETTKNVFGGFRDLPEDVSFDQLQQSVARWTTRIVGAQPGEQDYEEKREFLFWDKATGTFRSIVAPVDALRYAVEENTKTLNRIQGVFNVPAEGEVLVPFTALQQGFVPQDRFEQMQAQGNLAQAGTALNTSADNLTGAATAITAAANRWMAGGVSGLVNQGVPPGVARQAIGGVLGGLPPREISQMALNRSVEQMSSTQREFVPAASRMVGLINQGVPPAVAAQQFQIALNNRVTVAIDGRMIVNQLQRELYNRLVNATRSTRSGRGGGGTSMAVM